MQEYAVEVARGDAGRRLDLFLHGFALKNSLGISRNSIQGLILTGNIKSKNSASLKSSYKVKEGDVFKIIIADKETKEILAQDIPLEVIYEDDYLALVNKPCGLVVHPAPGNKEHTLANALLYRFKKLSDINPQRPGIVHRLDKETSGILVVAKDNSTHLALSKQFSDHSIKRKYAALVKGRMELDENIIELPIGRHPYKRKNMAVGFAKNTKYAKTYYHTLKRMADSSLLELEPFTGRTHQLRVHLAFIGHPILGDAKYGKNNKFSRLALHAKYLGFLHPRNGKFMEFFSEPPVEFLGSLKGK